MTTPRTGRRGLLRLSLPIIAIQVGTLAMSIVDSVVVGRMEEAAEGAGLSYVGIGHAWSWFWVVFGLGALMAIEPLISQAMGAGDEDAAGRAVQRGLLLALLFSIPVSIPLLLGTAVLEALLADPQVAAGAGAYSRIIALGLPGLYAYTALRLSLQSMRRVAPAFYAIVVANIVNLIATLLLVPGYEPWGIPPYGASGAAAATVASQWTMAAMVAAAGWRSLKPRLLPPSPRLRRMEPLARMIRLGAPSGLQHQLEVGVFAATAVAMERFGPAAAAGHLVALHLAALTFMVPIGLSYATAVLVGESVGRDDKAGARAVSRDSFLLAFAFMGCCGAALLLLRGVLPALWTPKLPVIEIASILLPVAAAFQVFDGLQVVAIGVLRGLGDLRTPAITGLLGFWLLGFPSGLLLGFQFELGPAGLWWGLVIGLAAVAGLLLLRIRNHWRQPLRRIRIEDPA